MRSFLFFLTLFFFGLAISYSQVPDSFTYQTVIRNSSGELIANQDINFSISIVEGSIEGSSVFSETQLVKSNAYGVCNLKIGSGEDASVLLSSLNWGTNKYFLTIAIDETGNTDFTEIGAVELLSVPYSFYSNHSASADHAINAEVASDAFNADSALYADTSGYSLMSGNSNTSTYALKSDSANVAKRLDEDVLYFTDTDTLFAVKDRNGNIVFAVYPDGAKVYVNNATKGKVGGFAVTGRNPTKASIEENYMVITADSTRVYIPESSVKGSVGGFAVSGRNPTKGIGNDYFNISGINSANVDTINPSEARMVWYPKSEAFLVGRVLIEKPDSVGINSLATGYESKAIGDYSQALGYKSIARSDYATAIGKNALANGLNSFAFGENAEAYSSESYSFGRGAKAFGYRSFAFGSSGVDSSGAATGVTQAKGNYSFAIGQGSITGIDLEDCPPKPPKYFGTQEEYWKIYYSGEGAVAIGVGDSSLASYATTIGYYNTASYGSVALGYKNKSYGMQSAILGGYSNTVNSSSSVIAGGHGHQIDAPYAAILGGIQNKVHSDAAWGVIGGGYRNEIYGSTSTIVNGTYNVATGTLSTVMGSRNNAISWGETVIGRFNDYNISGNPDEWISTDHLFVIGNGTADDNRSNAMVVLKNGNVGIGVNPGVYKLNVTGGNAYFSGNVSAQSFTDRTPYPKDLETAYQAVFSMNRLPEGEYDENNKENQLDHSTLHSFVTSSDGKHRDLSATVSAQNEVIKDLAKQIEDLKNENRELKQKMEEILERMK